MSAIHNPYGDGKACERIMLISCRGTSTMPDARRSTSRSLRAARDKAHRGVRPWLCRLAGGGALASRGFEVIGDRSHAANRRCHQHRQRSISSSRISTWSSKPPFPPASCARLSSRKPPTPSSSQFRHLSPTIISPMFLMFDAATKMIAPLLRKGNLVILELTSPLARPNRSVPG